MTPHDPPFLGLHRLRKTFGAVEAVREVNLSVQRGELLALLGPSGCGKTSTLRMIAGFVSPTSGAIHLRGSEVTHLPPQSRNMGMVFQNYALFPHMTVTGNIEFGLVSRRVPARVRAERIGWVLGLVGLSEQANRYPRDLSGGQQQRVALARVLALQPDLLLFDEPLSNLDAKLRVQMRSEIKRLLREMKMTALFVTHDQEEAMTMADRIAVMNNGKIEQIGTPQQIYDRPATRFVADFIGASNVFEGTVIRSGIDAVFRCADGLDLPAGQVSMESGPAVLLIRPEKVILSPSFVDPGFSGIIRESTLLGPVIEYVIELTGGQLLRVQEQRRPQTPDREVGTAVVASWHRADSVVLPA